MEIVFNDYSLTGQFMTDEDFIDSLIEFTFPLLDVLKKCSSIVLKKYDTYNLKVTSEISLYDLLTNKKYIGYSELQKLRGLLVSLTDSPYWENEPKSNPESLYSTEYTGDFNGKNPNCFSEAYERDKIIFSIVNAAFNNKLIKIKKDETEEHLNNFFDLNSSAEALFKEKKISFSELLYLLRDGVNVSFCTYNDEIYIDKEISLETISEDDVSKIIQYYKNWILGIITGDMLQHLTDSISYKRITYNEVRITLDNKRELRIFYKLLGSNYVFFNSLLKDTPSTPNYIKEKTYNLIKRYTNT